ncbi:TonB-dependent receptor [Asticcacaulis sp.]|uniref:TonB-dependent receptor n=1 Tax=Asticcacaulis sp. TaxID=1872648 RepID=UPI002BD7D5E9|nr:TonB-dependent receptor [Asticcacaulis sp.]HTM81525.1 TonB-dependent receptor [Asticcacaulis sp.]
MKSKLNLARKGPTMLNSGVSMLALTALVAGFALPANAQDVVPVPTDAASAPQEVVVVGTKRSLRTAQQTKRDADTIVDSITATDIGSFPDKSVAEALQRVAGITVTRFAATMDTSHFSAEPSGVLVRGLPQVRSEFNGRDTFSANSSRGLSWGDISPELMAGVDTYKNQTADLIEGGIAGSINLRTRLPFDSRGQLISVSAGASYGDISDSVTPDYSGIYTNRWQTSVGEFGLMVNYAHSYVETATNGVQMGRYGAFCSTAPATNPDGTVILASDGSVPCASGSPYGTDSWAYIPSLIAFRDNKYERTRDGVALAAQWQNNSHTMLATLQYNDSKYHNEWHERVVTASAFDIYAAPGYNTLTSNLAQPLDGTPAFTFDDNGLFQSGVMVSPIGWWGADNAASALVAANASGQQMVNACYGLPACGPAQQGATIFTASRINNTHDRTRDLSFNFRWDVNDHFRTTFDVQYIKAELTNTDVEVDANSFTNMILDFSGKYPTMDLGNPVNVNQSPGGLANGNNYYYRSVQDHLENSEGHEFATRLDGEYRFDNGGWFDTLKVGVRYADREQKIRWSVYNWANIANTWSNNASYWNTDSPVYPAGMTEAAGFGSDFMDGNVLPANAQFLFVKDSILEDKAKVINGFSMNSIGVGSWVSACERANLVDGCFNQSELDTVGEKTQAAYAMLKFGGRDKTIFNGISVQGNVGVRWVQTEDVSDGYAIAPTNAWLQSVAGTPCNTPLTGNNVTNASCWITPDDIAFSNGAGSALTSSKTHINWLPSFNVKFGLSDQWVLRFAASRSMSRPDMGSLKNYVAMNSGALNTGSDSTQVIYSSPTADHIPANVTGFNFQYTAAAGNPNLKSMTADNLDLSVENYFASVGSLTFDIFYKKFYDYIQNGQYSQDFTNNGVTRTVQVTGPINADGASIKGFEVAYQRFFDFLPAPFDGFGVQANYTHVVDSGISSAYNGQAQASKLINPHALEGLSEDAYNLVGMYEKGPWALRLAYNWRSKFLVTALDCCIMIPIWQDDYGQLDGSIRYKVNDHIELNLSGSNLSGSDTVLEGQVFGDIPGVTPNAKPVFTPNAWFKNDRRVQVGIRLRY